MDLSNLTVLVTGGGGFGVGGGICEVLSSFGATVVINELTFEKAQAAASKYPKAIPVAADLRNDEEVRAMFAHIREEAGTLNGLVNNAGIGLSKKAHLASSG